MQQLSLTCAFDARTCVRWFSQSLSTSATSLYRLPKVRMMIALQIALSMFIPFTSHHVASAGIPFSHTFGPVHTGPVPVMLLNSHVDWSSV